MKMTVVEQIYKDIENTFSIHDPVRKYFESRKQEWLQKEKAQQEDLCIHSVVEQGEKLVCEGCKRPLLSGLCGDCCSDLASGNY